ncbi:MAG: tetratricopeptide repeat protein [Pseudomonadota bacterium]
MSIKGAFLSLVLPIMLFGCASAPDAPRPEREAAARTPTRAPTLEQDGVYGFTMSEVVRIDSDVRRDYQRAITLLQGEQTEAGIELLLEVTERAPEVTIPHIDLGVAHMRLERYDEAEAALRKALTLAPNHPVALNEMGILLRKTGRFPAARESYERALAIHPGFHYALLNLGVLCDLYLADLSCALENYRAYADIVTDDPQVTIWIADLSNRLGVEESQ